MGVKNTAAVAQLGERVTCNHQVAGSNPAGGFVFMDLGSQSVNFGQRGLIGKGEWRKSRSWEWYGYELCDHELHIKAWPVDEVVHLDNSTVLLTESGEWRPKIRTFGTGMLEVGMGYFRLENGIKAVVFRHMDSEKLLVINSSGGYYVIIHPGVEKVCEIVKCLVD